MTNSRKRTNSFWRRLRTETQTPKYTRARASDTTLSKTGRGGCRRKRSEYSSQRGIVDSIAGVRDRQSALAGSVSNNMDFLNNLLGEKQAKMSAYDRFVELVTPAAYLQKENSGEGPAAIPLVSYFASFPSSFAIILDVTIAVFILFLLIILMSKSGAYFTGFFNLSRSLDMQRRGFGSMGSPIINIQTPSAAPTT